MPPAGRLTERQITPPADQVDSAIAKLENAKRPVIIVGHGARDQMDGVISLAETLGAPVITTFKAKGQIGDDHPLACGVLGRSGTPVASWVMNEADLLLVFGASFSNHTGIYPGHPIIQVDYDPLQLGKFHAVEIPCGVRSASPPSCSPSVGGHEARRDRPAERRRRPQGDLGR